MLLDSLILAFLRIYHQKNWGNGWFYWVCEIKNDFLEIPIVIKWIISSVDAIIHKFVKSAQHKNEVWKLLELEQADSDLPKFC